MDYSGQSLADLFTYGEEHSAMDYAAWHAYGLASDVVEAFLNK